MKHKILIVDDSIVNINALYVMLKDEYDICIAKNGKDGIKQANELPLSLILLDIIMPEMDGFEILRKLMKNPKTRSIPVMFITSLNDEKSEEKGLQLGAIDYITKPFNPSVIKAKVKNHIELYDYRKTIENIAMLDGLTSVPNRRTYNEKVGEYWNKALRTKQPISIAIIDIDCFKEYNDNYGHLQGDSVLKQVAQELKNSLPSKNGFLARYGGEEFVVVIVGVPKKEAYTLVDQMRKNVEKLNIEHLYSRAEKVVTVSIGGNTIIPSDHEIIKFVDQVDKRLYRAKSLGRNQTVWNETGDMRGQVEVFLFGNLKLLSKEGTLTLEEEKRRNVLLLLVFLITHRFKEYSKEELIRAIWPNKEVIDENYEIKELLNALKADLKVLHLTYIRELIVVINGTYHWNNNYMCIVDTELFQNLYLEVVREKDKERQYSLCEHAVELYHDDFLVNVKRVSWINEQRDWYRNMYYEMYSKLLALCYEKKEYLKILGLCQKNLYTDSFDDRIHYYYILALIKLKRNKEALEHFEYIVESYYSELGIAPPESIMNLYLDIVETTKERKRKIEQVESLMREEEVATGAFYCDLHVFQHIYQLEARNMIRTGKIVYLCVLDINNKVYVNEPKLLEYMQKLFLTIKKNLRIGDSFCKVSEFQFAILLPCIGYDIATKVMERILHQFYNEGESEVELSFNLVPVDPVDTVDFHNGIERRHRAQ